LRIIADAVKVFDGLDQLLEALGRLRLREMAQFYDAVEELHTHTHTHIYIYILYILYCTYIDR